MLKIIKIQILILLILTANHVIADSTLYTQTTQPYYYTGYTNAFNKAYLKSEYPTCDDIPDIEITSMTLKNFSASANNTSMYGIICSGDTTNAECPNEVGTSARTVVGTTQQDYTFNFNNPINLHDECTNYIDSGTNDFFFNIGFKATNNSFGYGYDFDTPTNELNTGYPNDDIYLRISGTDKYGGLAMTINGNSEDIVSQTRIESVEPENEEIIATSTATSIRAIGYINDDEFEDNTEIEIKIRNNAYNSSQLAIVSFWNKSEEPINKTFNFPITTSRDFEVSTTTNIQQVGKYYMTTKIIQPKISFWGFDFGNNTITSTTTTFTVSTTTEFDMISEEVNNSLNNLLESSSNFNCEFDFTGLFSFNNLKECTKFLFIPNMEAIKTELNNIKTTSLTTFPLGYINNFLEITSNTASSSMPILSATIPAKLGIGSPNITLDPNGALDFILNADGGDFTNSTSTFYETTNYYWKIIVSLGALLYIITRLIPFFSLSI